MTLTDVYLLLIEILPEEVLLKWATDREALENPDSLKKKLFLEKNLQEFVVWLRESVNESSDEEDDEDDDD